MRIKLDENLGTRGAELLRAAGHDVATVPEQGLRSAPDTTLIGVCRRERRCLVTLDMDFANPLRFRPSAYRGIAVLRLRPRPSPSDLFACVRTLVGGLAQRSIDGKLWTIQIGRIREYQEENGLDPAGEDAEG